MELIALINSCRQYTDCDFESCPEIIDVKPETTIKELLDWQFNNADEERRKQLQYKPMHIFIKGKTD
jgi:hypothetical protein